MPIDEVLQRRDRQRVLPSNGFAAGGEARQQEGSALLADDRVVDGAGSEPAHQLALRLAQVQGSRAFEQPLRRIGVVAELSP